MAAIDREGSTEKEDFHRSTFGKSHVGLFFGILVFAGAIVSVVMFHFHDAGESNLIFLVTDLTIHGMMLIATIYDLVMMGKLAFIEKPASVDDVLVLVAMGGAFMYEASVVMATSYHISWSGATLELSLLLSGSLVAGSQAIIQVILVFSGLRRVSLTAEQLHKMPGRGSLTFLILSNVTLWVTRTTQVKTLDLDDLARDVYGDLVWLMIINISLPLLLFYRFHASVCLADVWSMAYKPVQTRKFSKHIQKTQTESEVGVVDFDLGANMDVDVKPTGETNWAFEDAVHL